MKRFLALLLTLTMIISAFVIVPTAVNAAEDYRAWAQKDSRWSSIRLGSSPYTIGSDGCLVSSITKLIIQAGFRSADSFNIGTLANWLNSNGGYTSGGLLYWAKPSACVSGFNYYGKLLNNGTYYSTSYNSQLVSWVNSGYHITLQVSNGNHWIAIDEAKTKATGEVYIMDSSYDVRADLTLSSRYGTFNSAVAYTGGTSPNLGPSFTPVDLGTDFYANICNIPTYKRVAVAGTNVELKSANGDDSQKWKFERLDDTLYKITNVATGMCMEVSNFGTEDRTNIQVMPWADNDAQKWYFKIVRDGCYSLVPKCAVNSCIDTYGYFDDNTNIQLYRQNATDAQTFALNIQPAFEARNIGNSFVASIIHPSSDMAVTYDLSWNVIINPHSNAKSQQWLFEIMDDRSYKITNLASNMCLDVSNFGTANGTNIQLMPSADNIAQRWFIKAVGNGYSLVPKCACESAIDIDGVIKDGGNNIQLFRQNSYLNQIFSIRRVIDDNMVSVSDVVLNNNSEAVNPQISVKVDNTILKADSDYSVTIEADTTQEKGTVTITGINNYCGNVTKSFSITVIAQTEPTTPPTTPPTEPSIIKLGDVDGDDEVTIIDATCIQRKLASIATAKYVEAAADTDEDGELSIIDATVIQRWLAQLPTNENIGKPIA